MQENKEFPKAEVNHFTKGITLQEYVRNSARHSQEIKDPTQYYQKQNGNQIINQDPATPLFAQSYPSVIPEEEHPSISSRQSTPYTPLFSHKEIPEQTTKATFRMDPLPQTTLSQQMIPLRKTTYFSHDKNFRIKNASLTPARREKSPANFSIQGKAVKVLPELMTFYGSPKETFLGGKSKNISKLNQFLPSIVNEKKPLPARGTRASILKFC